jgi:hypothetical protein
MIKLRELIHDSCCDNCAQGKRCCGIHESAKEAMKGKKLSQKIQKDESRLRLNMWELVGLMSIDDSNKKLADELSRSYKKNVTIFMRDMLSLVKKMK